MKEIKLRECNQHKYCRECKKTVKIVMVGLDGYCTQCLEKEPPQKVKLYTLACHEKNGKFNKNTNKR